MADKDTNPVTTDSDLLYEECNKAALESEEKFRIRFNQDDLMVLCKKAGLEKVFDIKTLMPLVQALHSSNLFISGKASNGNTLSWALRPRNAAKQMRKLSGEEKSVYSLIEESHTNGMWVRNIKKRSNLTDQGVAKITEKLAKQQLIKSVKNVRAPAQKTWMLYHLAPSDDVTGGSFYDGGELDENLVEELGNLIIFHVRQAGWVEERRRKVKSEAITILDDDEAGGASPEESRGRKKRKTSHSKDIEDSGRRGHGYIHVQLAHPAHHKYPEVAEIHDFIVNNNFIRASKASSLTVDEVQNIINMLVWDEKLEPVNDGYRTVRGVKQPTMSGSEKDDDPFGVKLLDDPDRRGNGLTEMPCGRCPVLDICGKGGPINASTCVYFDQWLGRAVDEAPTGEQGARQVIEIAG